MGKSEEVEEHARLRAPVVYEIVCEEGRTEMERPTTSLLWSGVAAGVSVSVSLLAQAVLVAHLPEAPWRNLVANLGYTVGFLIVVLGRQQLFTENTITVVLPLLSDFSRRTLFLTSRIWSLVLVSNIAGTFCAALFCSYAPAFSEEIRAAMIQLSSESLSHGWWEMLFHAVPAGFLMAAVVWLIPSAEGSEFHVIFILTYLIAAGGFAHVVAGSVEGFMLVLAGEWPWHHYLTHFLVPAVIGNSIGGTALFAALSHAQVKEEME